MQKAIADFRPAHFSELMKLYHLLSLPAEWYDRCLQIHREQGIAITDLPVYTEDIFYYIQSCLQKQGETEWGLAVLYADTIRQGRYYHKHIRKDRMRTFGADDWFMQILPYIPHLYPKINGILKMREAMQYIWYYLHAPDAFRERNPYAKE